jgi:hypothetical protein
MAARASGNFALVGPVVAVVLGFVLAEGVLRAGGAARQHLRAYVEDAEGVPTLAPYATDRARAPRGARWTLHTGSDGLRAPAAAPDAPLVVGDSQVLGMGVADDEAFAARLGAHNAGVPGYGVPDALRRADRLLAGVRSRTVVVVVNQANDWDEGMTPVQERMRVVGRWLLTRRAAPTPWADAFFGSAASDVHVLALGARLVLPPPPTEGPPVWIAAPESMGPVSAAIAAAIEHFSASHPEVRGVVAYLPADLAVAPGRGSDSPFGRHVREGARLADTTALDRLRAGVSPSRVFVDLRPALADEAHFAPGDYHLSAAGHAAVATALSRVVSSQSGGPR